MAQNALTREQHLLVCLFEECAEVQQRVSKALRFGLYETQEGQNLDNGARIEYELSDLLSVVEMLQDAGVLAADIRSSMHKRTKVENYIAYATRIQMVDPTPHARMMKE